jgi:UDP-N-acetylmuramate--alanine ligase
MNRGYETFVENIPFYGFAALCIDHPVVQAMIPKLIDRRIVTYGFSPQADVRAVDLTMHPDGSEFRVVITDRYRNTQKSIAGVKLPMVGQHNVQNSLAAIAVAHEMGVADDTIRDGFAGFGGVKRRFTKTGEARGVTVIDDYGHHPVEIAAVLTAARQASRGRVIAVVQPHRYTRLHSLFDGFATCFNDADFVLVADVYSAGEQPIEGVNAEALVQGMRERGHRHVEYMPDPKGLAAQIAPQVRSGDLVVCLGAGSITYWAQALPGELEAVFAQRAPGAAE